MLPAHNVTQIYINAESPVQYIEFMPTLFDKILMCPFPFFCVGCCISKTTTLLFQKSARILTLNSYCGVCSCCGDNLSIPFDDIKKLQMRKCTYRLNRQYPFILVLHTKDRQFELTPARIRVQAEPYFNQVSTAMRKSRINFQEQK